MAYTNLQLVDYAQWLLKQGTKYCWGTYAQKATEAVINAAVKNDPAHFKGADGAAFIAHARSAIPNGRVCDCSGVFKGAVWGGIDGKEPKYNANGYTELNSLTSFNKATEKGKLATLPEIPGIALYMVGHVGVYIGGGQFIECKGGAGCAYGAVKNGAVTSGSKFTNWYKHPWFVYPNAVPAAPAPEPKPAPPTTGSPAIAKGSKVMINQYAVWGGEDNKIRGNAVPSAQIAKPHVVSELRVIRGNMEARLDVSLGWVKVSSLTLA